MIGGDLDRSGLAIVKRGVQRRSADHEPPDEVEPEQQGGEHTDDAMTGP